MGQPHEGIFGHIEEADLVEVDASLTHFDAQLGVEDNLKSQSHPERSSELMAAYGQAMAAGGALGPIAAALPLVELHTKPKGSDYHVGMGYTPDGESVDRLCATVSDDEFGISVDGDLLTWRRGWDDWHQNYHVNLSLNTTYDDTSLDLPDVFYSPGVADFAADDIAGLTDGPLSRGIADHYLNDSPKPGEDGWGEHVAQKYMDRFREELGLASFSVEAVRPLLEEALDDEAFLFEVNASIASGIFRGIAPPHRLDTVDPVPVATASGFSEPLITRFPSFFRSHPDETEREYKERVACLSEPQPYAYQIVGLSQEQYDALATTEADPVDPLPAALELVVGDIEDQLAASLADHVSSWWKKDRRAMSTEQALQLVSAVADLCEQLSPARVRQALIDLAKCERAWQHFSPDEVDAPADAE